MDTDSELLAYITDVMTATAENLERSSESLRRTIAQQRQTNAELTAMVVPSADQRRGRRSDS